MAKEISLDKRIPIKNLCTWDLYFHGIEQDRDYKIPAKGRTTMTRGEVVAQVDNGSSFFVGDGEGNHAKIFIDDKDTRIYIGFETEDGKEKQEILTEEKIKEILELKTMSSFKKRLEKDIITNGEKAMLIDVAKKSKLNDFEKIKTIEEYTGLKFETK